MDNLKVLVVEDEVSIRKFVKINLERNNFIVYEAETGEKALDIFDKTIPDVIVLDIMLPGIDGFEVLRRVREKNNEVIVIMLTAKSQDMDKIMGLELGADDYMVKPFNPLELVARINTIFRRIKKNENKSELTGGDIRVELNSMKVFKGDEEISLTPKELEILIFFLKNKGKVLSRNEILDYVWGKNYFGEVKTVDVHIRRLREKIEDDSSNPQYIETVWGYGYRWRREK
ncbi:response regulator transcription factor [Thermobrachium celere]|uniref:Stage 0 sporulation protein A homolog n=1 Tax=Thermobrachium celere DSM 8682 TaxID=941824 RepID=R7RQP4_9CLOT|nr:response regulator transcription factor [Thermobrachium celere]CDF57608.1 alkaline phosphatase synthesis transcriptional regulatory protein phoP [Thermobrachium celere DSM 8682]